MQSFDLVPWLCKFQQRFSDKMNGRTEYLESFKLETVKKNGGVIGYNPDNNEEYYKSRTGATISYETGNDEVAVLHVMTALELHLENKFGGNLVIMQLSPCNFIIPPLHRFYFSVIEEKGKSSMVEYFIKKIKRSKLDNRGE